MEKLLLTPEEVGQVLGVSRSKVYGLLRFGVIDSVKIGASRRVPRVALHRYLQRLGVETAA